MDTATDQQLKITCTISIYLHSEIKCDSPKVGYNVENSKMD